MRSVLERLGTSALELLFPPRCVGCDVEGSFLCASCTTELPCLELPYCQRCAQPLRRGELCERCEASPLDIDGIRAPYLMEGVIRECVHRLKYRNLRALGPVLGELLSEQVQALPHSPDVVIPVPLHPRRLGARGYNQASLLAREIGKHLSLPVVEKALTRRRDSPPQAASSGYEERLRNVMGSFEAQGGSLEGRRILLIDDVCTTGSTLSACAVALKAQGASSVWGLTLAREA